MTGDDGGSDDGGSDDGGSGNGGSDDGGSDDGGNDGLDGLELTTLFSVPGPGPIVDLIALDQGRLGMFTIQAGQSTTHCPECEAMDPGSDCPKICRRDELLYSLVDESGAVLAGPKTIRTYFPGAPGQALTISHSVRLSGGRIGIAWLLCSGAPANSCSAEYVTASSEGDTTNRPVQLYESHYGELAVVADPAAQRVLFLRSASHLTRAGAHVLVTSEDGTVQLDWTRVGSSFARLAKAVVTETGFLVVAEDDDPTADDSGCPPCATLPECLSTAPGCAWGGPPAPDGGLWAFDVTPDGVGDRRSIATGWGEDGSYHLHGATAAAWSDGVLVVVDWLHDGDQIEAFRVGASGEPERSALPVASHVPIRWLTATLAPSGDFLWVGEGSLDAADPELQPRSFLVGLAEGDAEVQTGMLGEVRGFTFSETSTEAPDARGRLSPLYWAGGVLERGATSFDHWEIYRLERR